MKKLFTVCICILLLAAVTVTAFAAETAKLTISTQNTAVMPGDTVDFSVSLSDIKSCRSAGLMLNYDKAVFDFVAGKCTVDKTIMADFSDGIGVFALEKAAAISGEVFTFRLKVKSNAASGTYSITAKGNARTQDGAVSTKVNALKVTVGGEQNATQTQPTETKPVETKPVSKPEVTIPSQVIEQLIPTIPETVPVIPETTVETTQETTQDALATEPSVPAETPEPTTKKEPSKKFQWWIPVVCGLIALGSVVYIVLKKKKQ